MEGNDWFIPKIGYQYLPKQRINERADSRKSFRVKFCNTCMRIYERFWENNRELLNYYDGFPSIGLDRGICKNCECK